MTPTTDTMTPDTIDSPCGDSDVLALPLSAGAHGREFHGEFCLVEKSNRLAFCIPAFRERFGAPERFNDDHPSISRVVRVHAAEGPRRDRLVAVVATLRAQAGAGAEDTARRTCEWREDDDDEYGGLDTTCGQTFVLNEGTTADNDMRFCCYCGGVLVAIRAVAP
jgi:hypothetical protein